jgi:hypothetical protein
VLHDSTLQIQSEPISDDWVRMKAAIHYPQPQTLLMTHDQGAINNDGQSLLQRQTSAPTLFPAWIPNFFFPPLRLEMEKMAPNLSA